MRTILTLVRHGQTAANVERVWHGSIDTPLSALGRQQADLVARHLADAGGSFDALYASPLRRARDTAGAIGARLTLDVRVEPDLAEYRLGRWEGRSYAELHHVERMWDRMAADPGYTPPDGESPLEVATRVAEALRRIAVRHAGRRVVAVSHGGALTLGLGLLLDGVPNAWNRVLDNCSVSELVLDPEPRLVSFNLRDHLPADPDPPQTKLRSSSRPNAKSR